MKNSSKYTRFDCRQKTFIFNAKETRKGKERESVCKKKKGTEKQKVLSLYNILVGNITTTTT